MLWKMTWKAAEAAEICVCKKKIRNIPKVICQSADIKNRTGMQHFIQIVASLFHQLFSAVS